MADRVFFPVKRLTRSCFERLLGVVNLWNWSQSAIVLFFLDAREETFLRRAFFKHFARLKSVFSLNIQILCFHIYWVQAVDIFLGFCKNFRQPPQFLRAYWGQHCSTLNPFPLFFKDWAVSVHLGIHICHEAFVFGNALNGTVLISVPDLVHCLYRLFAKRDREFFR